MLELVDVAKAYRGGTRGVDGVTLRLGPGLVGLLGPNGAGKSSLMRIAATVTRPTSGRVLFDGTDAVARPDALRRSLGYLPQDFGVYPHLSAREFLAYLAAVKGLPARAARARIGELLELFGLAGAHRPAAAEFSLGFTKLDHPLRTFTWTGLHPSAGFVAARLVLLLVVAAARPGPPRHWSPARAWPCWPSRSASARRATPPGEAGAAPGQPRDEVNRRRLAVTAKSPMA